MEETGTPTTTVIERIRKSIRPACMVAILRDGSRQSLALAPGRKRWTALERLLGALDWRSLECYDTSGALIDSIPADDDDDDDESEATPEPIPMPTSKEGEIATVVVSAVVQILDRWEASFGTALRAMSEVQTLTAARLAQMEADAAERAADRAAAAKLQIDEEEGDERSALVAQIIQAVGPSLGPALAQRMLAGGNGKAVADVAQ